jgi:hypothetical protein
VDVAVSTVYGNAEMTTIQVWAEQVDDKQQLELLSSESHVLHG